MRLRSFFLVFILVSLSSISSALEVQDLNVLKQRVLEYTEAYYKTSFGEDKFKKDVKIQIGNLDPRLRLAKCDDKLTFRIQEPPNNIRNITIKTACADVKRWSVYVPATINIYTNVLVAKHSLAKGSVISADDIDIKRVNSATGGNGLIEKISRAAGMELKRNLKTGETLRLSHLTKPDIVQKGQTVLVSSGSQWLSVETSGIALVNGHLGERIMVKNQRSNRVVEAKVIAPGKVEVATR